MKSNKIKTWKKWKVKMKSIERCCITNCSLATSFILVLCSCSCTKDNYQWKVKIKIEKVKSKKLKHEKNEKYLEVLHNKLFPRSYFGFFAAAVAPRIIICFLLLFWFLCSCSCTKDHYQWQDKMKPHFIIIGIWHEYTIYLWKMDRLINWEGSA